MSLSSYPIFQSKFKMSESPLDAYVASAEFQDLLSGRLLWGDLVPPFPPSPLQPTRDFSALAPRPGHNPFASLNKKREAPAPGPEPSVPGWRPEDAEEVCGIYMCPGCDGVFQCYCNEDREDARSYESELGCEDCGRDPCRCCSGCYPGCAYCTPDFNPADPWGDGAPEEHPGWYPDDWSDDE